MIISKKPVTILLLLLLVLPGCEPAEPPAKSKRKLSAQRVEVMTLAQEAVSHQRTISGTLEAATIVRLYNEVSGKIIELPYHEGDRVDQGTTLVKLDDRLIRAEMEKAVAQHKQAKLTLQRLQQLVPKNLASKEDLTEARTQLEIAQAEEKLQRSRLAQTEIKAVFDGIITERYFEPGDVVPQHSHILTLIDPSSLQVKLQLSENWIPLIEAGSPVEVTIDALDQTVHSGRITRVHPTIDPDTRKGVVEIEVRPVPPGAKVGQLVRVRLQSAARQRLLIPAHMVRHDAGGAYVFVVGDDNKAYKTAVTKGMQFEHRLEISAGLQAGQRVVTRGFSALRDGIEVDIVSQHTNSDDTQHHSTQHQ